MMKINLKELMATGTQRIHIKETETDLLVSLLDNLDFALNKDVYAWGLEELNGEQFIEIVKL